ncbi:MAG TPA: phosphotransferase family protein [Burkholderiaceae bacterium]|nr:phosphotransferase family protein [Burkholderiaceae bacterium]
MAPVDGFNATTSLPDLHRLDPAIRHRMGIAMVDAIVALGSVDYAARGLGDLGRIEGYLERQVQRWRTLLESYREYRGWAGPAGLPGVDAIGRWLEAERPVAFVPGIIHGDFHLANVMFRHDCGEVAALVDWELCTIGDPLLDLGWLLATWPDERGRSTVEFRVDPWEGFATAEELIERYEHRSGRDLSDIRWYSVLACYKLALILEGTHARACAGKATPAAGDRLHKHALALLERASQWIESKGGSGAPSMPG